MIPSGPYLEHLDVSGNYLKAFPDVLATAGCLRKVVLSEEELEAEDWWDGGRLASMLSPSCSICLI